MYEVPVTICIYHGKKGHGFGEIDQLLLGHDINSFSRTRLTIWKLLTRLGPAYGAPVVVQRFPVIGECAALVIICPTYPANVFCAAAVDCLCSFCWQLGLVTKFATSATRGGVFCRVVLEGMTRDIL